MQNVQQEGKYNTLQMLDKNYTKGHKITTMLFFCSVISTILQFINH